MKCLQFTKKTLLSVFLGSWTKQSFNPKPGKNKAGWKFSKHPIHQIRVWNPGTPEFFQIKRQSSETTTVNPLLKVRPPGSLSNLKELGRFRILPEIQILTTGKSLILQCLTQDFFVNLWSHTVMPKICQSQKFYTKPETTKSGGAIANTIPDLEMIMQIQWPALGVWCFHVLLVPWISLNHKKKRYISASPNHRKVPENKNALFMKSGSGSDSGCCCCCLLCEWQSSVCVSH